MNQDKVQEPKQSALLVVIIIVLVLIFCFEVGYFITKSYIFEKNSGDIGNNKEQVTTTVTPTPTSTNTLDADIFLESEEIVTSYLKPMTPDTQEKLRTSNLNNFLICIKNSSQVKDSSFKLFIDPNTDIVLGVQNWVENPDISIISSKLQNNQILVKARLNNFGQNGINYDFYLTKEIDPVSGKEAWLINDSNNTKNINPSDYNCSR